MARRLNERFQVGDRVEIAFQGETGPLHWQEGIVVADQPPGLWVQEDSGMRWFVTNGRRIRARAEGQES